MNTRTKVFLLAAVLASALAGILADGQLALAGGEGTKPRKTVYTDEFFLENCDFSSTGSNRFFILEPNYRLVLSGDKDGADVKLTITVLDKTKNVDGVETRVVEERETEDGELVEVSKNYFAICKQTNSVFYFGEDVDIYEGGKIVSHEGAWLAGKDGAKAGLMMPGIVLLNSKYQQETAPGVAMDRAWILSMNEKIKTPAGEFDNVLKTRETTPLEPGAAEFKYHASGTGLIQDKDLRLQEYGFTD